jgi:hypothetical protein
MMLLLWNANCWRKFAISCNSGGITGRGNECPVLGVKRTLIGHAAMSLAHRCWPQGGQQCSASPRSGGKADIDRTLAFPSLRMKPLAFK